MNPRARRLAGGGVVLLSLVGLWIGHTLEYVRVWGPRDALQVGFGSVHAYMLPLAGGLALLAAFAGLRLWRLWSVLGARLDEGRRRLARLLRGNRADERPAGELPVPSVSSRVLTLWPVVTALQIGFYLLQENVEAAAAGLRAPGLGAITGVHALAPLVHAGVALGLLLIVAGVARLLRRRAALVEAVEAVVRALLGTIRRAPLLTAPPSGRVHAPLQLIGVHLLRRPPPVLLAV